MLSGHQFVKYKPVKNIFGKGPHDDARDENLKGGSHFERRNRQQEHCRQRSNEHFAEKMMPVSVLETQVRGTWSFPIHAATTSALDRQL